MSNILLAAALAAVQPATPIPDPGVQSLSWLFGQWRGSGTSFGNQGTADLNIAPALSGKFVELRYSVATEGTRPFRFEGRAFYRPTAAGWAAHWFDSRGTTFVIDATILGSTLTSRWSGTTEKGQTVYRLLANGRLEVVDSVSSADGKPREFARYVYDRRTPAAAAGGS